MLLNIQALRAIAALMVVFVHLKVLGARAGVPASVLDFGNAGVDLFFVISGVIMVFTVERRETTPWNFLGHRIARVVPFYWLVTFAVFAVALVAPTLMQSTRADAADLIRSLAFIPFRKANGLIEPVVFVGWTLNYEMAFYALFAASMLIRPRPLSFAVCIAAIVAAAAWGWAARPRDPALSFYTYAMVLEFAAGVAIGWAFPRILMRAWMTPVAGLAGAVALVCLIAGYWVAPDLDRTFRAGIPAVVLVAGALIVERSGLCATWPLARRLGDASYAIYLTHFFVTQAATRGAVLFGLGGPVEIALVFVATLVGVSLVGLAVHRWVEAPSSRLARDLIFGRRADQGVRAYGAGRAGAGATPSTPRVGAAEP